MFLRATILTALPLAFAWNTFVVPHVEGADDTPSLTAALATGNYSVDATILFEKGIHYNIYTPIVFPKFTNVEVRIEGNLSYPDSVETIQGEYSTAGALQMHNLTCALQLSSGPL